jgi:hypothetical protein
VSSIVDTPCFLPGHAPAIRDTHFDWCGSGSLEPRAGAALLTCLGPPPHVVTMSPKNSVWQAPKRLGWGRSHSRGRSRPAARTPTHCHWVRTCFPSGPQDCSCVRAGHARVVSVPWRIPCACPAQEDSQPEQRWCRRCQSREARTWPCRDASVSMRVDIAVLNRMACEDCWSERLAEGGSSGLA